MTEGYSELGRVGIDRGRAEVMSNAQAPRRAVILLLQEDEICAKGPPKESRGEEQRSSGVLKDRQGEECST